MRISSSRFTPYARQEGLIVEELLDEVLVYDLEREKAHCLNRTAALVWNLCDGQTTVADMCVKLHDELDAPLDEQKVWLALSQLDAAHLLRERLPRPAWVGSVSRRDAMRRAGLAAVVVLPLVTSIVAPQTAEAASCAGRDQSCASLPCCSGCNCNPSHLTCEGNCA